MVAGRLMMRISALLVLAAQGRRVLQDSALEVSGGGNDVCSPEKGWIWNDAKLDDSTLAKRIEHKQAKALKLAKWIGDNHCIFTIKEGKMCMYQWYKLAKRVRNFATCALVPIGDGSQVSAMVWGNGEHNLQGFLQQVVTDMGRGWNGNKHVQKWLMNSHCDFHFDGIRGSIKKNVGLLMDKTLERTEDAADAILDDLLGEKCQYKKVWGLTKFRNKLKKNVIETVEEARKGNIKSAVERVQSQDIPKPHNGAIDKTVPSLIDLGSELDQAEPTILAIVLWCLLGYVLLVVLLFILWLISFAILAASM